MTRSLPTTQGTAAPQRKAELTFALTKASPPPMDQTRAAVREFLDASPCSDRDQLSIILIVEEWLANLIAHGCADGALHSASITLAIAEQVIEIRLEDDCAPFDPTSHPLPRLEVDVTERQIGGLGVHLIRSLVADMRYHRANGKNVWELDRRIDTPE